MKEMKKTIEKIKETKSWFFEKTKLINLYPDSSIIKGRGLISIKLEKKKKLQLTPQIQKLIRDYFKQVYANKMDNLEEMHNFLKRYNLPKLNQEETEN